MLNFGYFPDYFWLCKLFQKKMLKLRSSRRFFSIKSNNLQEKIRNPEHLQRFIIVEKIII